jgi:hypothetical protein
MSHSAASRALTDRQHAVLERALEKLGLGDAEGRRIFLLALGYELANYVPRVSERLSQPPPPPPAQRSPGLAALEDDVAALRARLAQLDAGDKDELVQRLNETSHFGHRYDQAYLEALEAELAALTAACAAPEPPAPPDPASDPLTTELVGLIAKAYRECFEAEPDADINGPFARLLATIFVQAGLDLPVTSRLIRAGLPDPQRRAD